MHQVFLYTNYLLFCTINLLFSENSYEKHYENKFISKNKQSDYNPYEYKLDINEINHSLNDNNEKMPVIKYDDDYYSESYFNEEALDVPTTYHWNVNFDYSIKDEYKIKDYYGKSGHMSDAEKMKRYNSNAARIKNFFSKYEKESTNIHGYMNLKNYQIQYIYLYVFVTVENSKLTQTFQIVMPF